jgi:hypothetical protein
MMRPHLLVLSLFVACGGDPAPIFTGGPDGGGDGSGNGTDSGFIFSDASGTDSPNNNGDGSTGPEVDYVYAHSPDTLYKVDPVAKTMTTIAPFNGCSSVIDLAIDQNQKAFVTTFGGVYHLDLTNADCTLIATGSYPNSLSFVPVGTLDPLVEAMVGYFGSQYVRIDTTTGNVTTVGALTNGFVSSGDIVSVKGGGTFLTVNGNGCSDCLLQVNPKTGAMIQNYGTVNHSAVYGIAFWAGTVYGFDNAGELFSITWSGTKIVTTNIPTTPGLQFWGAGSTTNAPATSADGGGIPIN